MWTGELDWDMMIVLLIEKKFCSGMYLFKKKMYNFANKLKFSIIEKVRLFSNMNLSHMRLLVL